MAHLLDTGVWIGLLRPGAPKTLKAFVSPWIADPDSVLCEPIAFELLRYASDSEISAFAPYLNTCVVLESPPDLWLQAARIGQGCRRKGYLIEALDLLISAVALHHDVPVVTFDGDYEKIAKTSGLKVHLLKAPEA
jgi:predicted nucleic acid-binding protein